MNRDTWTLGASAAPTLIVGDLPTLWRIATGRQPKPDLDDDLDVLMGRALELLHISWFTRRTGVQVCGRQQHWSDFQHGLQCYVDGLLQLNGELVVWEGKITGSNSPRDMLRYTHPQIAVECLLSGCKHAVLSVIYRCAPGWGAVKVQPDQALTEELIERAAILRHHVRADTEAPMLTPYPVPVPVHWPFNNHSETAA
jgi:hypothetical protein